MSNTVLEVNHLKTYYTMKKGVFGKSAGLVKAVDDVSFTIEKERLLAWWENQAVARQQSAKQSCA